MMKKCLIAAIGLIALVGCSSPIIRDDRVNAAGPTAQPRATGNTVVSTNVNEVYQTLDGWGTSLAWWGNVVGAWNDANETAISDLVFGSNGLGFNIVRYNIGGGKNPAVSDHMRVGAQIDSFKPSATAAYDWTADAAQRDILAQAKSRGANIFEAFSNSPPWWMTKSGDSAGNTDGSNNLKNDSYPAFADYITEVVKHFRDNWGITFNTVTPLNEPNSNWWKATNNQEGCHFDRASQATILKELGAQLATKGLTAIKVSAPEEYSIDDSLTSFNSYDATTKGYLAQVNTHQYAGSNLHGLRDAAWNGGVNPKKLYVSEVGAGGSASHNHDDITSALQLAVYIREAVQEMGTNGWVYWQAIEDEAGNNNWGLIHANFTGAHSYWVTKQYWAMANYSKLLRPGSRSIGYTGPKDAAGLTGSSYLDASGKVVFVLVNNSTSSQTIDLAVSGRTVGSFTPYVTSQTDNFAIKPAVLPTGYTVPAKSIVTLVEGGTVPTIDTTAWYKIINRNSSKVLDVNGSSTADGAGIIQWTDNGGLDQQWQFSDLGGGWYTIKNRQSGKIMDISEASKANGAKNIQWIDNGGTNQQWQLVAVDGTWYKIKNRNSSLILDITGKSLADGAADIQWPDNGGTNQQWQLVKLP